MKISGTDPAALATALVQATAIESHRVDLEIELTDLRNRRAALYCSLWDQVKRLRATVKGAYGDDSSQSKMVGGTRRSERKPKARALPGCAERCSQEAGLCGEEQGLSSPRLVYWIQPEG